MKTKLTLSQKAGLVSVSLFAVLLLIWQLATLPEAQSAAAGVDPEYAALMGGGAASSASSFPTPAAMAQTVWGRLSDPFYDNGPNDKGIGIQLAYSLARVLGGFFLAALVAIPLGFAIGNSRVFYQALNPYVQVLKPISPLAWMPLALYTIKDASASAVFVIFICSLWPMLLNTAHGVANVRKDWLDVSRTLEVSHLRLAFHVILPAAAPTILTGMRISMGIAWLVIVAAEMLVGGTGIGYFVWNEWNNLSITNVLFAIFMIGIVGMALDSLFGVLSKRVAYQE
jgi:nitrate/nitrite transport system permease protein